MNQDTLHEFKKAIQRKTPGFTYIEQSALGQKVFNSPLWRYELPIPDAEDKNKENAMYFWSLKSAKNIESFLRIRGYVHIDQEKRTASKDGKNFSKIGRILNNSNKRLLLTWKKLTNENVKSNEGKMMWVISANPSDLFRASYNRKWSSCTANGEYIKEGMQYDGYSLIAYLCERTDKNIDNPLGRYFIHVRWNSGATKLTQKFKLENGPLSEIALNIPGDETDTKSPGFLWMDTLYGSVPRYDASILRNEIIDSNNASFNIVAEQYPDKITVQHYTKNKCIVFDKDSGVYINSGSPGQWSITDKETVVPDDNSEKPYTVNSETLRNTCSTFIRMNWTKKKITPSYIVIEYALKNLDIVSKDMFEFLVEKKFVTVDYIKEQISIPAGEALKTRIGKFSTGRVGKDQKAIYESILVA